MENAAQTLHRLTSYEPGREWTDPIADPRIVQDFSPNDFSRLPWFFKRFSPELPRLPLPPSLPPTSSPALDVLAGVPAPALPLDLAQLGRILFLAAGVVRTTERPPHGTWYFRAAGSAGARFPLELYVAVPAGSGSLPPGVHWYDPAAHALVTVGPPPTGDAPAIITTGVPWRTGWRYRERGYRHVYWDAGTMLSQLLTAAAAAGLSADLYTTFADRTVASLVGADGVHEWPVAVVALGGAPALIPGAPAAPGDVDAAPMEFPLVTATQHAGDDLVLGAPWPSPSPSPVPSTDSRTIDEIILARGSTRRMNPSSGVPLTTLTTSMQLALRGINIPHFVAAHAVDDLAPALYRWPDLSTPIRSGSQREDLYRIALDQGLARDAAFVAIAAADLTQLGPHSYREAQLASGLVEGRLHLLAYALGAGASGMTFMDSEIPTYLAAPLEALIFTCVGIPDYKPSVGGTPGAPVEVRRVAPRD
ncbi:nitroreductase family protein [Actinoplanes sp. NPDC089786]|uniref:nitroreductase family protein n=1 Tax=Actinoplanes sp. NPDC089786 TaxID=3155185 RepID=UPI00342EC042